MAVDGDDFDVDIENVHFNIEGEDVESGLSPASEFEKGNLSNQDKDVHLNSCSAGDHAGTTTIVEAEAPHNRSGSLDNNDPQMDDDDGYDDLFTQINENEIKKLSEVEKNRNFSHAVSSDRLQSPFNGSENLPGRKRTSNETSSFFSTQDNNYNSLPPKRRFPGPAGILPNLQQEELKYINMTPHPLYQKVSNFISENLENSSSRYSSKDTTALPTTKVRSNDILLSKAPWKSMVKSLNLNAKNDNDLLNILNIKWVRFKAKRFTEEMKIPFLSVVVQEKLEITSSKKNFRYKNPSVKLMDPTGTIVAAFNPNFVEAYGEKIVPGTALALRNCGILRLKKHIILTVTKKNLLCLATCKEINEEDYKTMINVKNSINALPIKIENGVFLLQTAPLVVKKVLEEYADITDKLKSKEDVQDLKEFSSRITGSSTEQSRSAQLFSTVSSKMATVSAGNPLNSEAQRIILDTSGVAATSSPQLQQNLISEIADFSADASSAFDDDDDEELLQALEFVDFVIDEDSI